MVTIDLVAGIRRMYIATAAVGALCWPAIDRQEARGMDASPCANIEEAFAYNACLAKQNPRAIETHAIEAEPETGPHRHADSLTRRPTIWEYYHARNHGGPTEANRDRKEREPPITFREH